MKINICDNFQWRNSSFKALIPFIVFIFFYFGFSIITRDFSKVPMSIAFIISSAVALFLNHKEKLSKKVEIFAYGMGHKDIMIMCLIFILAGAFAASATAVGAVDAAVIIAQNVIPYKFMVAGLFVVSSLISLSIGTSCGTIAALVPIAVSLSTSLNINSGLVIACVVGGAMFGDNLSLISDTTIASTRTQNVEMKDKMLYNLRIVLVPAIICILLYCLPVFTLNSFEIVKPAFNISIFIKIIPYILLLFFGVLGVNVMCLLFFGTVLNVLIGLFYGYFDVFQAFGYIGNGIGGMANTIIVALLAGGLLQMVRYNGGINYIINSFEIFIKSKKLCEVGICLLVGIINLFTANNTVAIITSGPIAKELTVKYKVNPKRTASLLDTTSCIVQGFLPYGAQVLIAVGLSTSLHITSFTIIKNMYYPLLMAIGLIVYLIFSKDDRM